MQLVDVGVEGSKLPPGQVESGTVDVGGVGRDEVGPKLAEYVGRCRVFGRVDVPVREQVRRSQRTGGI